MAILAPASFFYVLLIIANGHAGWLDFCQMEEFQCDNKECVANSAKCNGSNECSDASDENDCPSITSTTHASLTTPNATEDILIYEGKDFTEKEYLDGLSSPSILTKENIVTYEEEVSTDTEYNTDFSDYKVSTKESFGDANYIAIDDDYEEDDDDDNYDDDNDDKECDGGAGPCGGQEEYFKESSEKLKDAVLFYSARYQIRAHSLLYHNESVVLQDLNQTIGVSFVGNKIYWTDIFPNHEKISRASVDGSNWEVILSTELKAPEDLDVDWITGNIYFTDKERQHVAVCDKNGEYFAILVKEGVKKPRGIAVHSTRGEFYWSDWASQAKISRALMDGTEVTILVKGQLLWPNGLTIDFKDNRLYWTDFRSLHSINLDGSDRRLIIKSNRHPYAIALYEDKIYWSEWARRSIQSCNKYSGDDSITLVEDDHFIYGLSVYDPVAVMEITKEMDMPSINPCESLFCDGLCLLKSEGFSTCVSGDRVIKIGKEIRVPSTETNDVAEVRTCNETTEFRCSSGECIRKELACNDIIDCEDSSDENDECKKAKHYTVTVKNLPHNFLKTTDQVHNSDRQTGVSYIYKLPTQEMLRVPTNDSAYASFALDEKNNLVITLKPINERTEVGKLVKSYHYNLRIHLMGNNNNTVEVDVGNPPNIDTATLFIFPLSPTAPVFTRPFYVGDYYSNTTFRMRANPKLKESPKAYYTTYFLESPYFKAEMADDEILINKVENLPSYTNSNYLAYELMAFYHLESMQTNSSTTIIIQMHQGHSRVSYD